jgi:23S rRNA-/tRNA-specific pseudouridylate synthase
MVCAKNQETVSFLQKQFSDRKVNKTYIAIIENVLNPDEGVIDVPLARNPNDPKTFRPDVGGKPAITEYHTIEHDKNKSIVRLHPLTGRTHQLRVHLQYMKHPIIGDELYAGKKADRLFLHAHTIEITLPGGERKTFTAPLPSEFTI